MNEADRNEGGQTGRNESGGAEAPVSVEDPGSDGIEENPAAADRDTTPEDEPETEEPEALPDLNIDAVMSEIPWEYEEYEVSPRELKKKPAAKKKKKASLRGSLF